LLARPANQISAADILDALEGKLALTECSGQHSNCGIESTCRVGHAWRHVNMAIRRSLEETSLAQLAGFERVAMRGPTLNTPPRSNETPLVRMPRPTQG
jgi:DNA-binding IscR family transcriptional regulator